MANGIAMYPNRGDTAELRDGSWQIPLSNLQDRILQRVARSTDLSLASTRMEIVLDTARSIRALVFVNSSVTVAGRKRVTAYGPPTEDDPDGPVVWRTGDDLSDGWEDVYPRERPTSQMEWRELNWWSGRPDAEDLAGSTQSIITVMPSLFYVARFTVELDDQENDDGYIDLGRLFVSGQWQFSLNYMPGAQFGFTPRTKQQESVGGTLHFSPKRARRYAQISWDYLPEAEAFSKQYEIQRRADIYQEVFWIADPDDVVNRQRFSWLGRLKEPTAISRWSAPDRVGTGLSLEELI